jgi:chemotaxis protein MotB
MEDLQPIIVIKKKGGHGGHHGGAWKVAYADFVTAMMALFIVLWLTSSTSKKTQEEIAGYFRDPKGTSSKHGADPSPQKTEKKEDMVMLKNDLLRAVHEINALNKLNKQIEMTITEEGLRIELLEDQKGTFFETGKAQPMPVLEELLKVLSGQLKNLPNSISIEGHTDAQPYADDSHYDNWELSVDRANVARHEMQRFGVRRNQVSQVRGFADQRLHVPAKPMDPANRRISLVVQSMQVADETAVVEKPGAASEKSPGAEKKEEKPSVAEAKSPEEKPAGEKKSAPVPAETVASVVPTDTASTAKPSALRRWIPWLKPKK